MKKLFAILCMFVLFSTQAQSQVFFSENFDGTSGTTPPAGWLNFGEAPGDPTQIWTFINVAVPPPSPPPSGAGFANEYAMLNSDAYGSAQTQNAVLQTPPISTLGRTNVHVNFSEQFRFISPSSGTFSISIDGGTTWDPIFVRSTNVGYPNPAAFTEIAIPQANNQADVRFRFRYEGSFGWWWAIDNFGLREGSSLVPLVGGTTYPINGVQNPPVSFENISSAVDYLNTNGVTGTGTVLFEMNTGYTGMEPGPISIGNVPGTGPTLGITFRPAAGFTAVTEVEGGASPNQHALALAGCSYVTLDGRQGGLGNTRDWTIRVTGTTNAQMSVRIQTNTAPMTEIHIRNLIMEAAAASITGAIFQITGSSANSLSNTIVEENMIRSIGTASPEVRGYGITVAIINNADNTGIEIRNNEIVNVYARGINITGAGPGAKYYGNRIYHTADVTQVSATEFSGIYVSSTSVNMEGTEIFGNMIYDIRLTNNSTTATTGAQGIYLFGLPGSGDPLRVYNNVISIGGMLTGTANNANVYGIRENTSNTILPTIDIFYNSVYISGEATTGANNSAGFYKQLTSNVNLSNNVFFNARGNNGGTGTHWGIRSNNTSFASLSNNDYFANGVDGVLGTTDGIATGNQTNIVDWRAAVGSDPGSVSVNPNYLNVGSSPPNLNINPAIASPLESGGITIAGITTDIDGTPRFPNVGYPVNPMFPPTNPDMGAYEFAGEPSDISPPAMVYDPLSNTGSLGNRTLEVNITDPSGVQTGANGPRLYYKKSTDMAYQFDATPSVSGNDYTFTINVASLGGVVSGDTIEYYVASQDLVGNAGTNPGGGAGVSPPGTTPPPTPNSYLVTDPPLAGDYTIGVILFREITGKNIIFEERVRTIEKEIFVSDAELNPQSYEVSPPELRMRPDGKYESVGGTEINEIPMVKTTISYEQKYYVPMLNGQEYTGKLYHEFNTQDRITHGISPDGVGVFATITEAVEELITVGVDGPTRFLLLDATYPSETFPITVAEFAGASVVNTATLLPAVGVTSLITGAVNLPIIRISNASHFIIDGRQDGVSNPHSLTISNTNNSAGGHGIQFIDGATMNAVQYCNLSNGGAATAGNGVVHFSTSIGNPDGNSMNVISDNNIIGGRSGILMSGTAGNQNNQNVIHNNEIVDFGFAGIWLSGNTDNTTISENLISTLFPTLAVANSGINVAASAGGVNEIFNNRLIDIQNNATTSVRGITLSAAASSVWNIYNNFFANSVDNGTKTSIYMIQNSGANAYTINMYFNSFSLAGTHVGGAAGGIVSCGYVKSSTGVSTEINYKNNVVLNTRDGGDGIQLGTWFGTPAGITDFNYNTHFSNGGATSFNSGYDGFVYNDLTAYQTAIAPHEANSLFKLTNFVSTTNLHLAGASIGDLDLIGTPIAGITTDIDGDIREPNFPYQGADEGNIPLPVDLASFTASVDRNNVLLNWTTTWEENNDKFVVERRIADNDAQWQAVGNVAGSGTVYEERHYSFTDKNLTTGTYEYRLVQFDYDGNSTADHNLGNTVEVGTPNSYSLSQNYPNPFNPVTKINFEIPVEGMVQLHIYDMSGRLVATLVNEAITPGYHTVEFNAVNMASGVYFYRLITDHSAMTKRMVLVK